MNFKRIGIRTMRKDMQKEIKKYQGNIYYFDIQTKSVKLADWIYSTADYDHYSFELHHFVPFTDWEKNTKNVRSKVNNVLILLPKVMHQHLENPVYKLPKNLFEQVYGIHPDLILFDINSLIIRTHNIPCYVHKSYLEVSSNTSEFSLISNEDLACFNDIPNRFCTKSEVLANV